jgi:hypothetical protein
MCVSQVAFFIDKNWIENGKSTVVVSTENNPLYQEVVVKLCFLCQLLSAVGQREEEHGYLGILLP